MTRLMLVFTGLLAGCVTAPAPRYYTLDMTASSPAELKYNLDVGRLRVNEALSRREILIKTSPTTIDYYALHCWAVGVDDLVSEKLQSVFGPPVADRETIHVSGTVLAFEQADADGGAEARIKLGLTFALPSKPEITRIYEHRMPLPRAAPDALAEALSRGLERLAAQIVQDTNAL